MNYITEINRFYDWLETNQVPKSAIALWHGLMHIANKSGWEPAFTVAISTIESKTGFKRSELFQARNILTQKGRILWRQRGGNLAAEYEIIPFCVHNTDAIAHTKAYTSQDTIATQTGTINKLNNTGTKLKDSSGKKLPVKKKSIEETTSHWKKLVDTWFVFYEANYSAKPTFNGTAGKNLKSIVDRIQKVATSEWTEEYAVRCFTKFLELAHSDAWLRENFLLTNLNSKYDSIVNHGTGKKQTAADSAGGVERTVKGLLSGAEF